MKVTQSEIQTAHEESLVEDEQRRKLNRLLHQAWESKGGPAAEERHFDWLRVQAPKAVVK